MQFLLPTRQDTYEWGSAFGELLQAGDVVAMSGDLGAGKTTLTQAIASGLGVTDPVTSPTFSLIQEYAGKTPMYHFDPYRLNHAEEIWELGLDEYLQRDGVLVLEWADLIDALLPGNRFDIHIVMLTTDSPFEESENSPRELTISGRGARAEAVVSCLGAASGLASMASGVEGNHAG